MAPLFVMVPIFVAQICCQPRFVVFAAAEFEEHTPNLRVFRNYAGYARE